MRSKSEDLRLGYEKSNSMDIVQIHKEMLGEPVWVVLPHHKTYALPWKGTVTRVLSDCSFQVKRFGGKGEEEKVDMYDIRSVDKKRRV